jgi:transposase
MALRYGNREQISFLPACVEEYVGPNDPVRAYDAFVDALTLEALGIEEDEDQVGNPEYDPRAMLKLMVYGYSYGERSSRKLERALYHNLSFMWLVGGLKPDHKTISNFRRRNKAALAKVLKQSVRMCMRLDLIEGNTLFVDGTKLRANASLKHTWNAKKCEEVLQKIDKRIDTILAECEKADQEEEKQQSLVELKEELCEKQALRQKIEAIVEELKRENCSSTNTVDKDCVSTKSTHGSYAGYNAQIAVDEKNGLIASCDVTSSSNDQGQLSAQVANANEVLGKKCARVVSDAGYSNLEDLSSIDKEIAVLVPIQRQTEESAGFVYNADTDTYTCPEGHSLCMHQIDNEERRKRYGINNPSLCRACNRFGTCTRSRSGRTVGRSFFEETSRCISENFNSPESQAVYKLRSQKVELPFGHMRRTMAVRAFLLRGLEGVRAEMSLFSAAFNIRRMITLFGGVQGFIAAVSP